jgi:signal peptidase I
MEPTLKLGDFVVGYKLPFGISVPFSGIKIGVARPKRGDVVVFRCPDAPDAGCVKRVIAISGDRIEIKKQRLVVNGHMAKYVLSGTETADFYSRNMKTVALVENWRGLKRSVLVSGAETQQNFGPYIVPPDSFFALADNRDMGLDSRHWGAIPNRQIEARLLFIWLSVRWSQETGSGLKPSFRFDRIFKPVR